MSAKIKALRQLEYGQPLQLLSIPTPISLPGQAIIRILAASIISYTRDIYNGNRSYPYPTPLTPGSSAVGRVHSLPSDSTSLQPNQLVLIDITYRSRDDPSHIFLSAIHQGHTEGSAKLMSTWRDGTYAEYASIPLENCYPLNESLLLRSPTETNPFAHNYTLSDLLHFSKCAVPYGGFKTVNLRPSETVIIAPATGPFGIAAVQVALSLGARVIAMGRNTSVLSRLTSIFSDRYPPSRLVTVPIPTAITESTPADLLAQLRSAASPFAIDAFLDISPPQALGSPHISAAISALRHGGRVCLMGGLQGHVGIPHSRVMHFNIEIKGKWMFEREDVRELVRMVEVGNLDLRLGNGQEGGMKRFELEEWERAFEWAEGHTGVGEGAWFGLET